MNEIYISTDGRNRRPDSRPTLHAQHRLGGIHRRQSAGCHLLSKSGDVARCAGASEDRRVVGQRNRRRGRRVARTWSRRSGRWRASVSWIQSLEGKPVFVAYPAGFDFLFVYWYLIKFGRRKSVQSLGAGHEVLRHGRAQNGLSSQHEKGTCRSAGSTNCRTLTWRWTMRSNRRACSVTC